MIKKVLEYFHIKCEINNKEVSLAGYVNILGKKRNIMQAYTVSQWFLFFFIYFAAICPCILPDCSALQPT